MTIALNFYVDSQLRIIQLFCHKMVVLKGVSFNRYNILWSDFIVTQGSVFALMKWMPLGKWNVIHRKGPSFSLITR